MRRRWALVWFLASTCLFLTAHGADPPPCPPGGRKTIFKMASWRLSDARKHRNKGFDESLFQSWTERYTQHPGLEIGPEFKDSPEAFLAYYQLRAKQMNAFPQLFHAEANHPKLVKIMRGHFKNGMKTPEGLEHLLSELYDQAMGMAMLGGHSEVDIRRASRARLGHVVIHRGITQAMDELGFLSEAGMREKFALWRQQNRLAERSLVMGALNAISLEIGANAPYMASLGLTARKRIPKEIIDLALEEGLDAAVKAYWPQLEGRIQIDKVTAKAGALYFKYMGLFGAYQAAQEIPEIWRMGKTFFNMAKEHQAEKKKHKNHPDELRALELEEWKTNYKKENGHDPDQDTIDAQIDFLKQIPETDL